MPASPNALINHKILSWLRRDLNISPEKMAKMANCSEKKYKSVENGDSHFSMNQLRALSKKLNINIAIFYFQKIPNVSIKEKLGRDFRSFGEELSIETISTIIKILEQREYFIDIPEENPDYSWKNTIKDSDTYITIAKKIRNLLGITVEQQTSWLSKDNALEHWRNAIEELGILVFKVGRISTRQFRGYSYSEFPFPIIIINNKDAINAQIFTLMHELVHIFIGNSGFSNPYSINPVSDNDDIERKKVEIFANYVAGEILIPRESIKKNPLVLSKGKNADWKLNEIGKLSQIYRVSDEVVFRRLLILGYAKLEDYELYRKQFQNNLSRTKGSGSGGNYYNNLRTYISRRLRNSLFDSYKNLRISELDLARALRIKRNQIYSLMNSQ